MAKIERFEDLQIWQDAAKVAVEMYQLSEIGRLKNDFGAKDQIRRAASSISNNIAEGFEYDNNGDFIRFLRYAKGSCGELRSQLYVLKEGGLIGNEAYERLYERLIGLSRQLAGFIRYLHQRTKES
ncbi:four helix bundle protein [Catalinimonas alkaloidigena]|uniref:Four helix bundle protein n=1 Tax=Catalinimonas alkaloidigena TaxID=1075417 RepID=A0A1G9IX81_9BACT|nr:four helix bundle protein [Catalinimonas alkaloidigena]SDL29563.1 four helix bundle protein [Catalinimonas alkaloidigena]